MMCTYHRLITVHTALVSVLHTSLLLFIMFGYQKVSVPHKEFVTIHVRSILNTLSTMSHQLVTVHVAGVSYTLSSKSSPQVQFVCVFLSDFHLTLCLGPSEVLPVIKALQKSTELAEMSDCQGDTIFKPNIKGVSHSKEICHA